MEADCERIFIACIFIAAATAAVIPNDGLRQRRDVSELSVAHNYLPPNADIVTEIPAENEQNTAVLADDGYVYKTVRRLRYRQRRDVSEIAPDYLPSVQEKVASKYLPPAEESATEPALETEDSQDTAVLGKDGYQYKTVRRLKYRHRRDVSEISPEYLPPKEEKDVSEYLPPAEESATEPALETEDSQDTAVLGKDGYQYKTVRRLKYRHRRDVSEIAPEYLPPKEEKDSQDTAVLGKDGYQYKTVRRLKYRHRRDVSEIAPEYLPPTEEKAASEYLPPTEESATEPALETEESQDTAVLGKDGYQYKTVRRLKYRHRRDVSEIASEYLPPTEEKASQDTAVLGEDGYQYKTVRRLKYRHRRDVSEIVPEYLPPTEESTQDTAVLGEDGYQYKTVRRLKYRHRRDVSEIASEYLPPTEEKAASEYLPPTEESATEAALETEDSQDTAVVGEDGYQYKTVRRLKYRHRRDVSEIAPEYLPPTEEKAVSEYLPPTEESATEAALKSEESQDTAVLGEDGYQYKTVRRLKYRHRRDVSEIAPEYLPPTEEKAASEYLPPVEESVTEPALETEESQDTAVVGKDGYQYKTVRRLKYRHRRDVSEIAPEYLPPTEEKAASEYLPPTEESATEPALKTEESQDTAVLGKDGYQYKTVRRLKYRHRRDVSEIGSEYLPPTEEKAASEYLTPTEESVTEAALQTKESQDTAVFGEDGYQYKTVRRLKYRHRRDVSEIASEYLPPTEEKTVSEYLPPTEESATEAALKIEESQDTAVLGEDGYQYKTVRRLKYRHRRDVSEIASEYVPPVETEYLPPTETESVIVDAPQESASLTKDGYQYKTIKKIKY
ncbi:fibrous sheath CABYR-binding protein [Teleopsis dalmanni]|uniref:fibrous sheath CABYR-binding protein n=1 Tax=Teleopsis dalmanni TaxID=139649 RepID=UPI0018CE2721|nr:fibrous sheath CABYR-binding protein [Teleopsis dalmanni]